MQLPRWTLPATVLLLISILTFSGWLQGVANTTAQDMPYQMEASDVLPIIARPLSETTSKGYYLPNVNLSNTNLVGVDFSFALLSFSDLSNTFMSNANLSGASLQEVNLTGAYLGNADLSNAWLLASNLEDTDFSYAILDNANLEDANLTGATVTDASFTGAIMENVTLPNGQLYTEGDDLVTQFGAKSIP